MRAGRPRLVLLVLVLVTLAGAATGLLVGRGSPGLAPILAGSVRPTIVVASRATPVPGDPSVVAGPARPSPTPQEYVVEPGDTLQTIAQQVYGNADLWPEIYAANRDAVGPDPDALQAGTRLRIPAQ
jgi:nucleoid-associated protein YgaU